MNTVLNAISRFGYRHIAKPILFSLPPDTVHEGLMQVGSRVQKIRPLRSLLTTSWRYDNPAVLSQDIAGITYENPVGLSAGFDKNIQLLPLLKAIGFGFVTGGSVTYEPCAGNPRPWFYRLPKSKSLVVNAGLANQGINAVGQRVQGYPKATFAHSVLSISVAKANSPEVVSDEDGIADYIGSLRDIKTHHLSEVVEINISCPNTYGGEPFTTPERLEALLVEVDKLHLSQPVYIKMPQSLPWQEFQELLEVIVSHQVTGVTIANLAKNRHEITLADDLPDTIPGNLSGEPTAEKANELIAATYRQYGDTLVIIGVGGIFSAEDAYRKIKLGASLVGLVTGLIFEGPQLIGQINKDLVELLQRDGYTHISQAIGVDNSRTPTA